VAAAVNIAEPLEGALHRLESGPVLLCLNVLVNEELLLSGVLIRGVSRCLVRVLAHHPRALAAPVLILVCWRWGLALESIVLLHFHACTALGWGWGDAIGLGYYACSVCLLLHILKSELLRL
jgi:hypothetical protein